MNYPPTWNEDKQRRLGSGGGCAIVCVSIAAGFILTIAVALVDDVTGLAVPREAVSIAFVVNGAFVAAASAFGGWASNEHVVNRVAFGLLAAGTGIVVYAALVGCFGWVYQEYV